MHEAHVNKGSYTSIRYRYLQPGNIYHTCVGAKLVLRFQALITCTFIDQSIGAIVTYFVRGDICLAHPVYLTAAYSRREESHLQRDTVMHEAALPASLMHYSLYALHWDGRSRAMCNYPRLEMAKTVREKAVTTQDRQLVSSVPTAQYFCGGMCYHGGSSYCN